MTQGLKKLWAVWMGWELLPIIFPRMVIFQMYSTRKIRSHSGKTIFGINTSPAVKFPVFGYSESGVVAIVMMVYLRGTKK